MKVKMSKKKLLKIAPKKALATVKTVMLKMHVKKLNKIV